MAIAKEKEPTEEIVNQADSQYHALLKDLLENGTESEDRTGTGTLRLIGRELRLDLQEGFPLLTTKRVWFRGVKVELLWMISGETNLKPLVEQGVHIWDDWPYQNYLKANNLESDYPIYSDKWEKGKDAFAEKVVKNEGFAQEWGELGPVYGYQWRHWQTADGREIDQLAWAIDEIKNNPDSRRIKVTAWNPGDIDKMALPPCHTDFQFMVLEDTLHMKMDQRSVDTFIGLPFNMAQYALLLSLTAQVTDKKPGTLVMHLGDTHLYLNHLEQAKTQLERDPLRLPKLVLDPPITNIDDISPEAISITGYSPHPAIEAEISVGEDINY